MIGSAAGGSGHAGRPPPAFLTTSLPISVTMFVFYQSKVKLHWAIMSAASVFLLRLAGLAD
jgi:hypothetical protein